MPYWGSKPAENDYAFDAVGVYVHLIKERMLKDLAGVINESYPEQGVLASLQCLRLLAEAFPKSVRVHFRKREFEHCRAGFARWYDAVKEKLPVEYREAILSEANTEFALFEERVLKRTTTSN
jgi:hypothetical protein